MKVTFYGQRGLPHLLQGNQATEERVANLARFLASQGHKVTVLGTRPFCATGNYHGVTLHRLPSLNPHQPGGWFYHIRGLIYLWRQQPDVVHVHTWPAALLIKASSWLLPHTTRMWTIDSMHLPAARFLRTIATAFDTVTTPSRQVQYQLLVTYGLRVQYIPDGYHEPILPDIKPSHHGLRSGQYCLALTDSYQQLKSIAQAYQNSHTRKKLVVLQGGHGVYRRLEKKYPFLRFVGTQQGRSLRSIINSAAVVILDESSVPPAVLLEAMHGRAPIVAKALPQYQEVLGTTAQYYAAGDMETLAETLEEIITDAVSQTALGDKAHRRAYNHFRWERLLPEYLAAYAVDKTPVLVDSVQPTIASPQGA